MAALRGRNFYFGDLAGNAGVVQGFHGVGGGRDAGVAYKRTRADGLVEPAGGRMALE